MFDISSLINLETRGKSRQFAHSLSDKLAYGQALGAAGLGQTAVETRQFSPHFRGDSGKEAGKSFPSTTLRTSTLRQIGEKSPKNGKKRFHPKDAV